jgi:sulfur-oxidizing protein SoxA
MTKLKSIRAFAVLAVAGGVAFGGAAQADENAELIVNGEIKLVTKTAAPDHLKDAVDTIYSGWLFRETGTQAMQMDDFVNPGMLDAEAGIELYNAVDGTEGKSCASCHGDIAEGMKGLRAVYPKWNEAAGEVRTMEMQVNDCRETRMGAEPYKYISREMGQIVSAVSLQSRGEPVNVAIDGPVAATWAQGKELYYTRTGILDLSCASCQDQPSA